jgi:four helix bundle protein
MPGYMSLKVWQHAHQLALRVYQEARSFPKAEVYGLTSQMRRAAVSIPSNLAEGHGRGSQAELVRYSRIALGSTSELQYQLLLCRDLGYLSDEMHAELTERADYVRRMLAKFIQTLSR